MPSLSVIIPTRQRADILRRTLACLFAQTVANELEVIVVHDGEDDDETRTMIASLDRKPTYLAIAKAQQGVARNRGIDCATAPLTLFIGDDMLLAPDACEKHLRLHDDHGMCAVLGFTTWDPAVGITPVMRWLEKSGWQFGYPSIARFAKKPLPKAIQKNYSYTIHLSLPTSIARRIRFREDASLYGWEDMEWGHRLSDAGLPLYYEPDANGLHHHRLDMDASLARMREIGKSAAEMERLNPALHLVPRGWKRFVHTALSWLPTMRGAHERAFMNATGKLM